MDLILSANLVKKDYQLLEWFHRTYEFSITECIAMLNGKGIATAHLGKTLKKGHFVIDNLEQGKTWAKNINACGEYFEYYKKRSFVHAMISCFKDKTFNWSIFFKELKNNSSKLKNQASKNDL